MDARLILAGQQPDFVNVLAQSNQAAQERINFDQQNALTSTLRQNGPGILAGDPNALNALARFDPQAALGVQQTRLGMDATRQDMAFSAERMQMAREQAKQAAAAQIAEQRDKLTKEQLAAEQQKITAALSGAGQAYKSGNKAAYDAFLSARGLDPAEYPFEQFPMISATFDGVLEAMKDAESVFAAPTAEVDPPAGYMLIDPANPARGVQLIPGYTPKDSGMTVYGPDGQPIVTTGGGKPLTEGQSKDNVFATRAEGALAQLEPVAETLTSRAGQVAEAVPFGLGRGFQGDAYQVAKNSGDEFLQAILRKDTGAAITEQEQRLYGDTYLPRPGDGKAVIQAKKEARARAVEALKAGMDPRQIAMTEQALIKAAARVEGDTAPAASAPASPPQRLRYNPATGDFE